MILIYKKEKEPIFSSPSQILQLQVRIDDFIKGGGVVGRLESVYGWSGMLHQNMLNMWIVKEGI